MNALVRKEIRLLLPAWAVAILLAALPVWIFHRSTAAFDETVWMAFIPGIMLISLSSFGHEFSGKTFSLLLAQPVPRARIWNVKLGLLGVALLSSWLVFLAFNLVSFQNRTASDIVNVLLWFTAIIAMASTTLWTMMLFRQVAAAFWISLLLPPVMGALLTAGMEWLNPSGRAEQHLIITIGVLAIYSVLGIVAARRLYFRAQDVAWTGGDISIAAIPIPFVNSAFSRGTFGGWRKVMFLFKKELQLQQMTLMFALSGFAAHSISLLLRKFVHVSTPGITATLIDKSWIFAWICWAVLPMFSGSIAVAEERKLGTLEGHLCLPVSRGLQFAVKLATVMLISVVLGSGLLYSFEWIGEVLGIQGELLSDRGLHGEIRVMILGWAWMGLIAFYCSSLARNALQALGLTVVAWAFSGVLYVVTIDPPRLFQARLWSEPLGSSVIGPLMVVSLLILTWSNFKRIYTSGLLLARNLGLLTLLTVLSMSVTAFTYHRGWKSIFPPEPKHGAGRISGDDKLKIATSDDIENPSLFVLLPDGRIWKATSWRRIANPKDESIYTACPISGEFMSGTNWFDVVAFKHQAAAIQRDGSLWLIDDTRNVPRSRFSYDYLKSVLHTPRQIGTETNWLMLAASSTSVFALKRDGTLWGWGGNHFCQLIPDEAKYVPDLVQVGTNRDWISIRIEWEGPIAKKKDGSEWEWGRSAQWKRGESAPLRESLNPVRFKAWFPVNHEHVFVAPDGSIRKVSQTMESSANSQMEIVEEAFSFERDWISVAEAGGWYEGPASYRCFGLKKNGTLHAFESWDFSNLDGDSRRPSAVISNHSDWRSIASVNGLLLALAQDGIISVWHPDFFSRSQLLAPSYFPLNSLNIFDAAEKR